MAELELESKARGPTLLSRLSSAVTKTKKVARSWAINAALLMLRVILDILSVVHKLKRRVLPYRPKQ
jgi:hypothetical protein